jgi:hypothetical protein
VKDLCIETYDVVQGRPSRVYADNQQMFEGYNLQDGVDLTFTPEPPVFDATNEQPSDYLLSRSTMQER